MALTLKSLCEMGIIEELACLYATAEEVKALFILAEIPAHRMPVLGAMAPDIYWFQVLIRLDQGMVVSGVEKLLTAAYSLAPGNDKLRKALGAGPAT